MTSPERSPAIPDTPTLAESGLPGFNASSWFALFAPKGTPPEITSRLNAEVVTILQAPDIKARFANLGGVIKLMTPDELAVFVRAEHTKWAKAVKDAGVRLE